jgi:hypothetical protein
MHSAFKSYFFLTPHHVQSILQRSSGGGTKVLLPHPAPSPDTSFKGVEMMNGWMKFAAISAAAMLAACDGDNTADNSSSVADPLAERTLEKDTMESTQQVMLETATLQEFKTSLAFMRASLSEENREELTQALEKLSGLETAPETESGEPGSEVTVDPTLAEAVYNKQGDKLDGKTFEDVIAMAG